MMNNIDAIIKDYSNQPKEVVAAIIIALGQETAAVIQREAIMTAFNVYSEVSVPTSMDRIADALGVIADNSRTDHPLMGDTFAGVAESLQNIACMLDIHGCGKPDA